MNSRSFRMLTFVFAIGVIVGAITSFALSTLGASTFITWRVRESDVVLGKAPAQIRSSRRLTENPRSQLMLNVNVSHLLVTKSAVVLQTILKTKNSDFSHTLKASHATSVTYLSSAFNQMRKDKTLSNRKSKSHNRTVTYRKDGVGPPTKTPRTAKPYKATLGINVRSNKANFAYSPNTDATRRTSVYLSQNRFVTTAATRNRAAAGFPVTAPSKPADLSLSTVDPQALLAQQFKPIMSTEERSMLMRSLKVLASLLQKTNVTYFLYGGTLLGCFRHRGLIPWDDDLDILANYSQVATLRRALENVPGYKLDLWTKSRYKFYAKDARPIPRRAWLWPFIDIFFFNETDSRIFDISSNSTGKYSYSKKDVLPLVNRPFDGLWLPVPHNEEAVVMQDYDFTRCMSNVYSHKNETYIPGSRRYSTACTRLHAIYPFAFRNVSQSPIHEVVRVGDKIIAEYNYI